MRIGGKPRFRTVDAATAAEARRQRALLSAAARSGELVLTPTLTFAEVATRWLAEFEAKVAAGARRERTLENYRNQLERDLLPRLGRRRLHLITADQFAALMAELQAQGLAPWTVRGIMVPLACVFGFAVRRGHLVQNPARRRRHDHDGTLRHSREVACKTAQQLPLSSPFPPRTDDDHRRRLPRPRAKRRRQ